MKHLSDSFVTSAAAAGILACLGDIVIPSVLARMVPGYDANRDVLSRLGCADSPVRLWINAWWCVFGVLIAFYALGFLRAFSHGYPAAWVGVAAGLLFLFGLGAGPGAGIFPMDVPGTPPSRAGALHHWLSGGGIAALSILPAIGLAIFGGGRWPVLFWLSAAAQVGGIACAALIGMLERPGSAAMFAGSGFWQRAFLANYYLYLTALSVAMLRCSPMK